jgi:hypothetical protein
MRAWRKAVLVLAAATSVACVGFEAGDVPASIADAGPSSDGASQGSSIVGLANDGSRENVVRADAADAIGDAVTDGPAIATDVVSDAPPDSRVDAMPLSVASPHLRLWLTAATGITCASSRVVAWADQSGHHDDATLQRGQLGPQCQLPGGTHVVRGVDLPYFSAPTFDGGVDVLDETLDVDLSFLKNTAYTVFTVERRSPDYPNSAGQRNEELILGTTMPLAEELMNPMGCSIPPANNALFIGYVYYSATPEFVLDQTCNTLRAAAPAVAAPAPSMLTEHTVELDPNRGREIWAEGVPFATDVQTAPLVDAEGGAIGRALLETTTTGVDPRFRGDIAEVVVYDVALSDADQSEVEAYLQGRWGY